jgi:hypothetical protein
VLEEQYEMVVVGTEHTVVEGLPVIGVGARVEQQLSGGETVGGPIVAISQASQPEEPVGQRLVMRRRLARAPGPGGNDLDVPAQTVPTGEAVLAACARSWSRSGSWGSEAVAIATSFRSTGRSAVPVERRVVDADAPNSSSVGGLSPFRGPGGTPRAPVDDSRPSSARE